MFLKNYILENVLEKIRKLRRLSIDNTVVFSETRAKSFESHGDLAANLK
jgi:hypothetical protein